MIAYSKYIKHSVTLILLIIADILFELKIDPSYMRSLIMIYVLLYGIGNSLVSLFQIDKDKHDAVRTIVYSVGLSIAFLMIAPLLLNTVLNMMGLYNGLTQLPLLLLINAFVLISTFQNIYSVRTLEATVYEHKIINPYDLVFGFFALILPVVTLGGTMLLNNGGPNTILMGVLTFIGVFIVLQTVLSKKISEYIYPLALFSIGLSILFMIAMRSNHVTGTDILSEYRMFHETLSHGYWTKDLIKHAYNACISITILPVVYASLIRLSPEYVFKFLMQITFATVPVTVYLYSRKYTSAVWAFLGSISFIAFPIFISSMAMHVRQEVAFIFFALMIYSLFDDDISHQVRGILYLIFGFSMVISHYSTTYIALGFFTIWFFLRPITIFFLKILHKDRYDMHHHTYKKRLDGILLLILYMCAFLWYTQVTNIGNNLGSFGKKVLNNLNNTFNSDVRVDQTSAKNQFNIFYKQKDNTKLLDNYYLTIQTKAKNNVKGPYYSPETYASYKPVIVNPAIAPLTFSRNSQQLVLLFAELIKKIQKVFIVIGVFAIFIVYSKKLLHDSEFVYATISAFALLILFTILPFVSIDYDLLRTTQQVLILLSYPSIYGAALLFTFVRKEWVVKLLLSIFLSLYLLIYMDYFNEIMGGSGPSYQLNNYGGAYERSLVVDGEVKSAQWLEKNKKDLYLTHVDPDSMSRVIMSTLGSVGPNPDFMPQFIFKNSYVYFNSFNLSKNVSFINVSGESIRFLIPRFFFDENKDVIYNNGSSQIYY